MASKTEQKKVTKNDLIDAVYQNTNVEKRVVQQVVEDVIVEIKKFLCEGTKIEIRGFQPGLSPPQLCPRG
ncbi:MAG: HU family DNA-binding protein, partial [Treponema sp.]|nr:HU family DNA-binding protein [Treponema sp.]